jgi:ribosomal protein L7/L12
MSLGEIALGAGLAVLAILVARSLKGRAGTPVPVIGSASMEDVQRMVSAGRKIDAIKIYRSIHGVGLREAKDAGDAMTG